MASEFVKPISLTPPSKSDKQQSQDLEAVRRTTTYDA